MMSLALGESRSGAIMAALVVPDLNADQKLMERLVGWSNEAMPRITTAN